MSVCKDIHDISYESCREAGLGEKSTNNLLTYLEANSEELKEFPFDFKFEEAVAVPAATKGIVCISGKLKSYKTKANATEALQKAGYEVKGSLTKNVTILVNESGIESAKTKKARESGVTIISNLLEFLGE